MMQVNSFISSFKNRRILKRLLLSAIFIIILYVSNLFFEFILVDNIDVFTRLMIHELYKTEDNIDVLFIGSSHCYRSLNPEITDQYMGCNTFNAGTSAQGLDGSYALLVEAGKHNDLKQVYLEMYYGVQGIEYKDRTEMTQTYIISDYLRPSMNKISYLLNASEPDYWLNSFILPSRYGNKIFENKYVADNIKNKMSSEYKNYDFGDKSNGSSEYYVGKGFVVNNNVVENNEFYHKEHFETSEIQLSSDDKNSLNKIVEYCRKRNIELVLFSAPVSDFQLVDGGNYDAYIEQVSDLAAQNHISYYNFNLCKPEYFSYDSDLFMDSDHLNYDGANEFSKLFSEVVLGKIDNGQVFYQSYNEKLKNEGNKFLGVVYTITYEDEKIRKYTIEPVYIAENMYDVNVYKKNTESEDYTYLTPEPVEGGIEIEVPRYEEGVFKINICSDKNTDIPVAEIKMKY